MFRVLLTSFILLIYSALQAKIYVVVNLQDTGVGSLRVAIDSADAGDTIRFDSNLTQRGNDTLFLYSEIAINKSLHIIGIRDSLGSLAISGRKANRIFNINLDSQQNRNFFIDSLIVIHGLIPNNSTWSNIHAGGAIRFNKIEKVLIRNSVFEENIASHNLGGAIYIEVEERKTYVNIFNCRFRRNISRNGGNSLCIHKRNHHSELEIEILNTIFDDSESINNSEYQVQILDENRINENITEKFYLYIDSTIFQNASGGLEMKFNKSAGGFYVDSSRTVILQNCDFKNLKQAIKYFDDGRDWEWADIMLKNVNIVDNNNSIISDPLVDFRIKSETNFKMENVNVIHNNLYSQFGDNRRSMFYIGLRRIPYHSNYSVQNCKFIKNAGVGLEIRHESQTIHGNFNVFLKNCIFDSAMAYPNSTGIPFGRGFISATFQGNVDVDSCIFTNGSNFLFDGKNLKISNSDFINNQRGGIAVYNGNITLENSNIINNGDSAISSGGLRISNPDKVRIRNVIFENNYSNISGGALRLIMGTNYSKRLDIRISDSKFLNNKSKDNGGAVYSEGTVTLDSFILDNCIFTNNTAKNGGVLGISHLNVRQNVFIKNSQFFDNTALQDGGVFHTNFARLVFENSILKANKSQRNGGVGFCGDIANLEIDGCTFDSNQAISNGGALAFPVGFGNHCYILLNNSNFTNNKANFGGVFGNMSGSSFSNVSLFITASNTKFINNSALSNGGVIQFERDFIRFSGKKILFLNNHAEKGSGGGFYFRGDSDVDCDSCLIENNSCYSDGGFLFTNSPNSDLKFTNSTIANNVDSTGNGGAFNIQNTSYSKVDFSKTVLKNNSSKNLGGGIYAKKGITNNSYLKIEHSLMEVNSAENGGAIYTEKIPTKIEYTSLLSNLAIRNGGAIYFKDQSSNDSIAIIGSTIAYNLSDSGSGGAFYFDINQSPYINILNATIAHNQAKWNGDGIFLNTTVNLPIQVKGSIFFNAPENFKKLNNDSTAFINSGGYNIFKDSIANYDTLTDHINIDSSRLQLVFQNIHLNQKFLMPNDSSLAIDNGDTLDFSDAQNGSFTGIRDIGSVESCVSYTLDTVVSCYNYFLGIREIHSTGIYYDTLINSKGCDSIVEVVITINTNYNRVDTISCDSIMINGSYYYSTAVFIDTLKSLVAGKCDSVITYNITINNSKDTTINHFGCDSIFVLNKWYYDSTLVFDSLITFAKCDSFVNHHIAIYKTLFDTTELELCKGDIYDGVAVSRDLSYTKIYHNQNGCDDFEHIIIKIKNVTVDSFHITACDTFRYRNIPLIYSIIFADTLTAVNGCDSIVHLNLKINKSIKTNDHFFGCDSILYGNNYFFKDTILFKNLTTHLGCDSLVVINLKVNNSVLIEDFYAECDSFLIDQKYFFKDSVYVQNFITNHGCDSIVKNHITIFNSFRNIDTVKSCNPIIFNGYTYNQTVTLIDTFKTYQGCDSISINHLLINPLNLNILFLNDTLWSEHKNGNYSWLDCDNLFEQINGENRQYFAISQSGNYAVQVDNDMCIDTSSCLSVTHSNIQSPYVANKVSIYPNPFNDFFMIEQSLDTYPGLVQANISDVTGSVINTFELVRNAKNNIHLNGKTAGFYFVNILFDDGSYSVYFLIKQ